MPSKLRHHLPWEAWTDIAQVRQFLTTVCVCVCVCVHNLRMHKDVAYTNTVAPEKGQTTFHQRGCPKAVVGASHIGWRAVSCNMVLWSSLWRCYSSCTILKIGGSKVLQNVGNFTSWYGIFHNIFLAYYRVNASGIHIAKFSLSIMLLYLPIL